LRRVGGSPFPPLQGEARASSYPARTTIKPPPWSITAFPCPCAAWTRRARGCGGPVAAAVILPERDCPGGINDSKKLTEKTRARLCRDPRLRGGRRGIVHPEEIDRLNIYWATMKAMTLAVDAVVETLGGHPAHVLVDGNRLPKWGMPPPRSSGAMPVAGDRRGLDRGQACPRRDDDRGGRAMARLWLAQQHGVWIGDASGGAARTWPSPLHRRSFAPVAQCYLDL
jgi:ribonuclease HII